MSMNRNSGKNSGHYSPARKAAEVYKRALRMLERAVLKDQADQDIYDETMFTLLSRQVLAYFKAYPNDHKDAVETGQRALKLHAQLRADVRAQGDIVKRANKTRYNTVRAMMKNATLYYADALAIGEDFDQEVADEAHRKGVDVTHVTVIEPNLVAKFEKLMKEGDKFDQAQGMTDSVGYWRNQIQTW